MEQTRPRIFISYAQYDPAHAERVLALAHALAVDGLDVELDQFHGHEPIDWPRWCDERLRPEQTDYVLMVCSAEYRRRIESRVAIDQGRGVFWEGNLIYGYLYREKANERFVPVLLDDEPESFLPAPVASWNHFRLRGFGLQSGDAGYEGLYRLLTNQPATLKPTSGVLVRLPPRPLPEASQQRSWEPRPKGNLVIAAQEESVFRLTSVAVKEKAFGTGFVCGYRDGKPVLVTCAHVIEELGGVERVRAGGYRVELIALGSTDGNDLALLTVPDLKGTDDGIVPALQLRSAGEEGLNVRLFGYDELDPRRGQAAGRGLEGCLTNKIRIDCGGEDIPAWDLLIEEDRFLGSQPGYSGSPIWDRQTGLVVAVVSHALGRGDDKVHALDISNLLALDPRSIALFPEHPGNWDPNDPRQLYDRLKPHRQALASIWVPLIALIRRKGAEVEPERAIHLEELKAFLDGKSDAKTFLDLFNNLIAGQRAATTALNYQNLAKRLLKGRIVLFLGPNLSEELDSRLLPMAELPERLRQDLAIQGAPIDLPTLADYVCQHTDYDLGELTASLAKLVEPDPAPQISFYEAVARIERPLLIVTYHYARLLESAFEASGKPYFTLTHLLQPDKGKPFILTDSLREVGEQRLSAEKLAAIDPLKREDKRGRAYSLIYRCRGDLHEHRDALVISEPEYLDLYCTLRRALPDYLANEIRARGLWYLGHHPGSWEERIMVRLLCAVRGASERALAIQRLQDPLTHTFWVSHGAEHHALSLAEFFAKICAELAAP